MMRGGLAIDRQFLSRTLILWLLMCWPLLIFGRPAYFGDTPSYFRGGAVAVQFVTDKIEALTAPRPSQAPPPGSARDPFPDEGVSQEVKNAKGVRSVSYSVFSYVLAGTGNSLVPLAAVQALMLAICIACAFPAPILSARRFPFVALTLAVATPVAWFAAYAMPDLLAGLTILSLALIATRARQLGWGPVVLLLAIAAFSVSAHASHMLLALATLFVAAIARPFATPGPLLDKLRSLSWIGLAVLGSLGMVLAVNYIAFKEVGLAPKRYPFVLARAMELPSARHYLETACRTPRYELCRQFPHGLPEYAQEFLWGSEGISEKATPQQIDRLRAEEPILIWQVLRAAPVAVTAEIVEGVLVQLTRFGISDIAFDRTVHMTSPTEMAFVPAANDGLLLRTICRYLIIGSVVSSLIALLLWLRRTNDMWFFAVLLCGGVIANAAICATLSTIAERYQARVIWLLPLAAFALWAERKGDRAPPK